MLSKLLIYRNTLRFSRSLLIYPQGLIQTQSFGIKSSQKTISTKASDINEEFDNLMLKLTLKTKETNVKEEVEAESTDNPFVIKQKDDVVYINGVNPRWRFLSPLSIGKNNALSLTLALYNQDAIGLLLKKQSVIGEAVNKQNDRLHISQQYSFGSVTNIHGMNIRQVDSSQTSKYTVNIDDSLRKTSFKRDVVQRQLYSGHMRIDIGQPLTQGNVIVFKGERNSGKTRTAFSVIQNFLRANKDNRAIYVGLSNSQSIKLYDGVQPELQQQLVCFTVGGQDSTVSDAEYFLAPKVALQFGQEYLNDQAIAEKNLLFVFDDVLLHHYKEMHIFDLASQPFAPINMINEIMENTGVFLSKNSTVTSILIVDTESSSLMFQKDEQTFVNHIDSISDQILEFNVETNRGIKTYMPLIDMKPNNNINDFWKTPYLRKVGKEIQELLTEIKKAQDQHVLRKQLKIDEDPWDNYLIYDSKYFMPLICHSQDLALEEQVLVAKFIKQSIKLENISEYKPTGQQLIKELLNFAKDFMDDEDDPSILERLERVIHATQINEEELETVEQETERVIKMFYLHMRVVGQLKPYKEDYFI